MYAIVIQSTRIIPVTYQWKHNGAVFLTYEQHNYRTTREAKAFLTVTPGLTIGQTGLFKNSHILLVSLIFLIYKI